MYLNRLRVPALLATMAITILAMGCSQVKAEPTPEAASTAQRATETSTPTPQPTRTSTPQVQPEEAKTPVSAPPQSETPVSTSLIPRADITAPPARETQAPQVRMPQEQRPVVQERAQAVQTVSRGETPTSIQIPAIGVNASIVPLGLDAEGAMAAPEGPFEVGWFYPGARPGERGNVLLDGHVDWTNKQTGVPFGAVFWSLRELGRGDAVHINAGSGSYTYIVERTVSVPWNDPSGISYLQPTDTPTVTIITCGGVFDRAAHNYSHRIIVVARLAG